MQLRSIRYYLLAVAICTLANFLMPESALAQNSNFASGSVAGNFEVRLTEMENDLRELRGMLETLQFKLDKMQEAQTKQAADVEFRLGRLEGGKPVVPQLPQVQQQTEPTSNLVPPTNQTTPALFSQPAVQPKAEVPFQSPFITPLPMLEKQAKTDVQPQMNNKPSSVSGTAVKNNPQKEYDRAYGFLKQADYDAAEVALQDFLDKYPEHKLAGNAQYWLGETYYVRGKYEDAAIEFGQGFDKYPEGAKAPDSLYKLGMSMAKLNRKTEACRAFGLFSSSALKNASADMKKKAKSERVKLGCK